MVPDSQKLSEEYVQDSFHSYLKTSLANARSGRLLEPEVLANAEEDLMITGPALCLYLVALHSTTTPPTVPLPGRPGSALPRELTAANCPPAFLGFFHVWASTVPKIRSLAPKHQDDLVRILCGQQLFNPMVSGIAALLLSVAIDISQRRSFQERYVSDLPAAAPNASDGDGGTISRSTSTRSSLSSIPIRVPHIFWTKPRGQRGASSASSSSTASVSPPRSAPPAPSPTLERIRQILYAALGDALAGNAALGRLLKSDPPRAYFASLSLAILEVGTRAVEPDGSINGGPGLHVTLEECPEALKPLMAELANVGTQAENVRKEDREAAVEADRWGLAQAVPRLDQLRRLLREGVGDGVDGRVVAFSNRINALALKISKVETFRERQREVFEVLSAVCGN